MALAPRILGTQYRPNGRSTWSGDDPISYSSFSGADIVATIRLDDVYYNPVTEVASPVYKTFAELQTISISSARNVFPVRRLGESQPKAYTRGARTIAGSLIFAMFSRDVFQEIYRMSPVGETFDAREPFFVDQLPEFDIIVNAVNEHGVAAKAVIGGMSLSNFGTTMSIHDIYTEATYSYVARWYIPLTEDISFIDRTRQLLEPDPQTRASDVAASAMFASLTEAEELAEDLANRSSTKPTLAHFIKRYY